MASMRALSTSSFAEDSYLLGSKSIKASAAPITEKKVIDRSFLCRNMIDATSRSATGRGAAWMTNADSIRGSLETPGINVHTYTGGWDDLAKFRPSILRNI